MLRKKDAIATVAVKDLERAKKFYANTLGLEQVDAVGDEAAVFQSGNSKVMVYRSQYAGTNQATALSWTVGDELEGLVRALKSKGVTFEHYDMPEMKLE